jgi:pyruvate,water dikinase
MSMGADRNRILRLWNGRAYFRRIPVPMSDADMRLRRDAREDLVLRLQSQGVTIWDHFRPEIIKATKRLSSFDLEAVDLSTLAKHLEEALAVRRRHSMLHPMISFKPRHSYLDALAAVSGLSGEDLEVTAYQLLDGEETILSRLIDGLYALARTAGEEPNVAALLIAPSPDAIEQLAKLPEGHRFTSELDDFLVQYGERTGDGYGSEATIRTPTWREAPGQVLDLISVYLDAGGEAPSVTRTHLRRKQEAQIEAYARNCGDEQAMFEFRRQLVFARKSFTALEEHNHYIDQLSLGQLRHVVTAVAKRLVTQVLLEAPEDIFWLKFDQILEMLRTNGADSSHDIIAARRALYAKWEGLKPPVILGTPAAELPARPPLKDEVVADAKAVDGRLLGLGASPGVHRGRARVIGNEILMPELLPGDILVAENAGPRWAPLFPVLGGLVLETGSLGQHAAATAREYGVPAVIGTGNAARRIIDGMTITVDGTAGIVTFEPGSDT